MSSYELLISRRSVRKYTDQPVPDQTLKDLLHAAMCAPSAGNEQPWHFVLIKDKGLLGQVPAIHPHARMTPQAAAAIMVCGDESLERHKGYWVQDCSAATQNLLLAAHALGLGAVWLGIYPREERVLAFRNLVKAPAAIIPFALVPLGFPAEKSGLEHKYVESRVHHDLW